MAYPSGRVGKESTPSRSERTALRTIFVWILPLSASLRREGTGLGRGWLRSNSWRPLGGFGRPVEATAKEGHGKRAGGPFWCRRCGPRWSPPAMEAHFDRSSEFVKRSPLERGPGARPLAWDIDLEKQKSRPVSGPASCEVWNFCRLYGLVKVTLPVCGFTPETEEPGRKA